MAGVGWRGESWQPELEAPGYIASDSQEAERTEHWHPAHFPFFIQAETPALEMVLPYPAGSSCLNFPVWKSPHRYAQRFVSKAIGNPVNLTASINHHTAFTDLCQGTDGICRVKAVSTVIGLALRGVT